MPQLAVGSRVVLGGKTYRVKALRRSSGVVKFNPYHDERGKFTSRGNSQISVQVRDKFVASRLTPLMWKYKEGGYTQGQVDQQQDLDLVISRGKEWDVTSRKLELGLDSMCHYNTAKLFTEGKIDAVVTGFALYKYPWWMKSVDWVDHSWGIKEGKIIETTWPYAKYYGTQLTKSESERFSEAQLVAYNSGDYEDPKWRERWK